VIAFDDCFTLRTDDFAYVDAFLAVANFIGAALQREQSQKALLAEQHARASVEAKARHEREAAIFQERARFAGQIHDTLAQGFTGTLLHLEALRVRAARGQHATVKELENVRNIAALGLAEARRSALAIRPLALDGRDIPTALQQLAERSAVPGLVDCRWSLSGIPRPIPPIADEALLNIAHEAVSNAIRHADAANIQIILDFAADGISLHVCDNGIGFDASESRQRGHTFGLRSMRERAFAAGGELKVVSKHGEGTTVTVHLRNV
jgi:signal transduction histidine kinase